VDGYFKLARFRTSSRGLRDREYSPERPTGTIRVAVVGSSFSLPSGVELEDAFHSVLEERLTTERSPPAYEFINFAVGGYGPRQALAMLRLEALDYSPDLVLFTITDLTAPYVLADWDRPLPPKRDLAVRHAFWSSFLVDLIRVRLGRRSVVPAQPSVPRSRPGVPSVVEKLAEVGRTTGIPIVVVRLEYDYRAPTLVDLAVESAVWEAGLYFVDTRDAFAGTKGRDFWIYELDRHPNAHAHEIFADAVATFLDSNGLIGTPGTASRDRSESYASSFW